MDIPAAQQVMLRTHLSALSHDLRASGLHLESGPGVGKSAAVDQMCAALAKHLDEPVGQVVFMLATVSSVDVRGFMLPTKPDAVGGPMGTIFSLPPWMPVRGNTIVYLPDGTRLRPNVYDGPTPRVGVLFLDEFSQAEDEVKKPAAELVLNGNVGTAELPLGWRVVAAGNRMGDRSGVMRELMFIVNRRCKLSIDAMVPPWIVWANAQVEPLRPHYMTVSFAQKQPHLVFRDAVPAGSDPFCTPRTLCLMDRDLRALRTDDQIARNVMPTDALAREVCAGWIGSGEAAQYFVHLKYDEEIPDVAEIERDPLKAKLPAARDAQMVCGYMLAQNLTDKNAPKIMAYLKRLQVEMQVLTVRAVVAQQGRAKAILNTVEFGQWLAKHKDLLIAGGA